MRTGLLLDHAAGTGRLGRRQLRQPAGWLITRLRAPWLDRELAAGVAPWRSAAHAARSLQLTSGRSRRSLARSLERLAELAQAPAAPRRGTPIPPCRGQVREALPLLSGLAARLRSAEPVDARGVAKLRALLADGGGPCFVDTRPHALSSVLHEVTGWLGAAG